MDAKKLGVECTEACKCTDNCQNRPNDSNNPSNGDSEVSYTITGPYGELLSSEEESGDSEDEHDN